MIKNKYFATIDGGEQEYTVTLVEDDNHNLKVTIDGVTYDVDMNRNGDNFYSIIIDNKSYMLDINSKGDKHEVLLEGDAFTVEVLDDMKKMMKARGASALKGRQVIDTAMPGQILKVLVEPGEEVVAGQPLLILVAMKMENEIKSPKDGIVQEVFVAAGQTVASGDKLAVVD